MQRNVVSLLAFGGGFVVMSLELLGGRVLAPYFGSSIYVWGSIITIFMLSLALGYLIGGRLSMRHPSLRRFALLFVVGAVLTYPLILYGDALMRAVFDRIEDPRYGSLVAGATLFMLPTIVLGMISPYAVRLMVTETRRRTCRRFVVFRFDARQRTRHASDIVLSGAVVRDRHHPDADR